jgi:negative regulator of flagellin synthesis FlgM
MSINNINNTNKPQLDASKLGQQQVQNQSSGVPSRSDLELSSKPAPADSVSLTPSARHLSEVQQKGFEAPVNREKVDRLKQAIADGDYQVNPEILAKKIAILESQILGVKV